MKLSKSIEDYLEAILILELKGEAIQSVKIAHFLGVSKPAVSKAMQELAELGFINKAEYGDINFTDAGREAAQQVYERHVVIKQFLLNLGVDEATAEHDCCLIEHVVSHQTFQKIKDFNEKN